MQSLHLSGTAFALLAALVPLFGQPLDPDPEIFDGTRTRTETPAPENAPATDDWQQANLILYDSEEQGLPGAGVAGTVPGVGIPGATGIGTSPGMPSQPSDATMPAAGSPPPGSLPAATKPSEVSIGDSSKTIATSSQPVNKVQGGQPSPEEAPDLDPAKGTDQSPSPGGAGGQQSGPRGGGVEKGDAMPTDI